MASTGPPFYATDAPEAARALTHQQSARRRQAFQAAEQARLAGNPAAAKRIRDEWIPIIERKCR